MAGFPTTILYSATSFITNNDLIKWWKNRSINPVTNRKLKESSRTWNNLLKESFRMNPDYVIVGEKRGDEAYVLFQCMASGHPSFGTMHAG